MDDQHHTVVTGDGCHVQEHTLNLVSSGQLRPVGAIGGPNSSRLLHISNGRRRLQFQQYWHQYQEGSDQKTGRQVPKSTESSASLARMVRPAQAGQEHDPLALPGYITKEGKRNTQGPVVNRHPVPVRAPEGVVHPATPKPP